MNYIVILMALLNTFTFFLQVTEVKPTEPGFFITALGVLGSAIAGLALYIKNRHNELKNIQKEHTDMIKAIYDKTVSKYEELSKDTNQVVRDGTVEKKLLNQAIHDLSNIIKERLK